MSSAGALVLLVLSSPEYVATLIVLCAIGGGLITAFWSE